LILIGKDIAEKQEDMVQEVTGPPRTAAFDKDGNPTKAAIGFAKKYGLSADALEFIETPKGEYLFVKNEIPGRPASEVLSEIFPKILAGISWPKSMRWGNVGVPFVRPVHWVLALLKGEVIPFDFAGVSSGNKTMGHRFMGAGVLEIDSIQDYLAKMTANSVMIDPEERRQKIHAGVNKEAAGVDGVVENDPELLATVANLVEYPSTVCGSFDREFLDLPDPVLITAMKKHQKYFAVREKDGVLKSSFVAVNNTKARDDKVVCRGHEKVLRARLSDAAFFFREDRKSRLEDRLEGLKDVIYQAGLGTSFDKIGRFTELAEYIAEQVSPEKKDSVALAARLCKCDLITEMVMEFPTLQGVMGKEYARLDGHPDEVCLAIHEHYLPARAGDELPASSTGSIVGLADRMDTIAGCFIVGQEPTGAADPFALRRHALAIIRILEEKGWAISLKGLILRSLDTFKDKIEFDRESVSINILTFFRERYRNRITGAGYDSDLVDAVISAEFDRISQLCERIDQLRRFASETKDFEPLALTFKRVSNILKKQDEILVVDTGQFKEGCETDLWNAYLGVRDDVSASMEKGKYFEALTLMAGLRSSVDEFFEGVEIMIKDNPELMKNRIAILQSVAGLFLQLADFSRFSI
jgi:glycyl-tRNA synthetase beta chain